MARPRTPESRRAKLVVSGEKIRLRRQFLGLTQSQLGSFLGVDPANVSRWEQGLSGLRPERRAQLATVLECDEVQLFPDLDVEPVKAAS